MTSIARRLFRIIFGAYFIVTLLLTCVQLIAEYRDSETRVTAEIKAMQQTFGPGIANAMWRYEDDVLLGILRGIKELPIVVGVTIEDEKGNLLHAIGVVQDKNGAGLLADSDEHLSSAKEGGLLFGKSFSQVFPVVFTNENGQQRTVGKWTVYSNQSVIIKRVQYGFSLILVNAVIKTIALWFIFLFVVKRWLGTPLTQLTRFVQELKFDNIGDRVFVLKDQSRHELHFLADTLNETLGKLQHSIAQNNSLYLDLQREQASLRSLNETLEQRIAERTRELSDAKQMLEISSQQDTHSRMKFLAKMSHEFRTPLNTVLGYAELLQRGSARVSLQEGIAAIKNSSRHLLGMIDDILDHVRGESGQLSLRLAPVHWGNFIKSLEQGASMMLDRANHFQLILGDDMPEAVMVDELRLHVVLNNLLSNANRYTQGGSVTLTCASAAVDGGHRRFTFMVSDTGQGITTDEQKRIFQPFVRGTAGKSSGIDGIGIGLVIAQQWVNLMGGEICVDSNPGRGSRFSFSIVCELAEAVPRLSSVPEHAVALGVHTLLVVEDDENSRNLLAMLLADYGFNVLTAKSGNDARQFFNGQAIDLVITDQFMPDGDGWSVLMDWSARNIPLILLSATPPDRPKNLPETLRFADVQLKPLDANTLLNTIGGILAVEWAVTKAKVHDEEADTIHRPPMQLLAPLKAMIEQGAVTDITEWLEIFSVQYPQYRPYAARIATANLMLDFKVLRRLTT
ncbi:MAG: ATP-binding protein [Gallionella sp.]|nr:ATP-binding protein [Gallionella sp.]